MLPPAPTWWQMKDQNECQITVHKTCFKRKTKEKESDDNLEKASSKDVVSIVDNSTQNAVFESDTEDKPNINFSNTPKVPR